MQKKLSIAVIGGTGPQGKALAYRFARGGHEVTVGSRSAAKAESAALEITERLRGELGAGRIEGDVNAAVARSAQWVVLAVPYEGHDELISTLPLEGKMIISCVNPLVFDKDGVAGRVIDDGQSSAAESAQRLFPTASVIGAFHNVSAVDLWSDQNVLEDDVLVVGNAEEAKETVIDLTETVTGRKGVDGGQLRLARVLEPLTAVLISVNKKYKARTGIKITGLKDHS